MSKDDDKTLFRNNLNGVNRLSQDKVSPYRKPLPPTAKQQLADEQRVLDELLNASDEATSFGSGDELRYIKDGYPPRLLKKLRRGEYSIQDQLDLHGLIASEAKQETHRFINDCAADKVRAVRIIHGKGLNSRDKKPVLKNLLLGWLTKNQHVIAVCSSPNHDGGSGAVYVLLG